MGLAPPPSAARRSELADFLRDRRARVTPEIVGLPANGRRRTAGLRREEVARLAGVELSWYTWLEQGRDIRPSAQVLDALARVLRLALAERAHLFHLARVERPLPGGDYPREAPRAAPRRPGLRRPARRARAGQPAVPRRVGRHDVRSEQLGSKTIEHPRLGTLRLYHLQSAPTSHPELRLTQFVPADEATRAVLAGLA